MESWQPTTKQDVAAAIFAHPAAQQAALFGEAPVDATIAEANAAWEALRHRVEARLTPLHVELRHLAAIAQYGETLLGDRDLHAMLAAILECAQRLADEVDKRKGNR